jgi:type VI secretion system protein ImpI
MALTLTIENMSSLPDGGPLSITVPEKRGIDIGRNAFLDWTLPDPSRFISGKHCEVRHQGGEFLLYDVSTNGTFLNGAQRRMQSPHRLRSGDRLLIGEYVVTVSIDASSQDQEAPGQPAGASEYWASDGDSAPPIDPRQLRPAPDRRAIHSDFLEQAMGSPDLYDVRSKPAVDPFAAPAASMPMPAPERSDAFDWAPLNPRQAPAVELPPPTPSPRRATPSVPSGNVWGDEPVASTPRSDPPLAFDPAPVRSPPDVPLPRMPVATPLTVPEARDERASPPVAVPPVTYHDGTPGADFVQIFAQAAGLPPDALSGMDAARLADLSGQVMRSVVAEMMQLLSARNEARRLARNPNQTMASAADNNPLKFAPTAEEAMRIMFGPPKRSYLDAPRALAQGFADIKAHHVLTYAAMQAAVRRLAEELDPAEIEKAMPPATGIGERLGSPKARLWDVYTTRWEAKTEHHDDGLVDVFMLYFGDCYAKATNGGG